MANEKKKVHRALRHTLFFVARGGIEPPFQE